MAGITIKMGDVAEADLASEEKPVQISMSLQARRSLDGNYMIFDHPEIDIVIIPKESKIVSFSKEKASKEVYDAQDRLFSFLRKKGVINFETVQGGNLYNSLEAEIPESQIEGVNSVQSVLFNVGKFLEEERPYYSFIRAHHDQEEEAILDPDTEHSTELGEVPQEETKGSIMPGMVPYALYYEYR